MDLGGEPRHTGKVNSPLIKLGNFSWEEVSMNPFVWRREHQTAIIFGAILGAVILIVIGFMYRGLNFGDDIV
jgi:hypothetical protein